jgi:hypothetical protein
MIICEMMICEFRLFHIIEVAYNYFNFMILRFIEEVIIITLLLYSIS